MFLLVTFLSFSRNAQIVINKIIAPVECTVLLVYYCAFIGHNFKGIITRLVHKKVNVYLRGIGFTPL